MDGQKKHPPRLHTHTHSEFTHCKSIAQFCLLYRTGLANPSGGLAQQTRPYFTQTHVRMHLILLGCLNSVWSTNRQAGDTVDLLIRRCYGLQTSTASIAQQPCCGTIIYHSVNLRLQQRCETKQFQCCATSAPTALGA